MQDARSIRREDRLYRVEIHARCRKGRLPVYGSAPTEGEIQSYIFQALVRKRICARLQLSARIEARQGDHSKWNFPRPDIIVFRRTCSARLCPCRIIEIKADAGSNYAAWVQAEGYASDFDDLGLRVAFDGIAGPHHARAYVYGLMHMSKVEYLNGDDVPLPDWLQDLEPGERCPRGSLGQLAGPILVMPKKKKRVVSPEPEKQILQSPIPDP